MKNTVRDELEEIRKSNGGVLRPVEVVEFARDPNTKLHGRFEWDDSKAAEKYRLEQARMIIRFEVRVVNGEKVPAYFSFVGSRKDGDSYNATLDILESKELTELMISQALAEARSWAERHKKISRLRGMAIAVAAFADRIDGGAKPKKPKLKRSRTKLVRTA